MTKSAIEWTDEVWNPVTGCSKVSPGCAHCYAERVSHRFGATSEPWIEANARRNVVLQPDRLSAPLHWRKPRRVFVNSMSDLFHELIPDEYIAAAFGVMAANPNHTFQVLTKRPERMLAWFRWLDDRSPDDTHAARCWAYSLKTGDIRDDEWRGGHRSWPLSNVWLGVSVENQHWADERIPLLVKTPAVKRFISAEPLLGPVNLRDWMADCGDPTCPCVPWLDWVIVGGESGPKARRLDADWVRAIRDDCAAANVPLFFKQWGGVRPGGLATLDGREYREFPK